jgi:hypothetical protein
VVAYVLFALAVSALGVTAVLRRSIGQPPTLRALAVAGALAVVVAAVAIGDVGHPSSVITTTKGSIGAGVAP